MLWQHDAAQHGPDFEFPLSATLFFWELPCCVEVGLKSCKQTELLSYWHCQVQGRNVMWICKNLLSCGWEAWECIGWEAWLQVGEPERATCRAARNRVNVNWRASDGPFSSNGLTLATASLPDRHMERRIEEAGSDQTSLFNHCVLRPRQCEFS